MTWIKFSIEGFLHLVVISLNRHGRYTIVLQVARQTLFRKISKSLFVEGSTRKGIVSEVIREYNRFGVYRVTEPSKSRDGRTMKPMRVYIDTSVFGGFFDEEFSEVTTQFFDTLFAGKITALISDTLVEELIEAPRQVQDLLERTLQTSCERFGVTEQTNQLKDAYLQAGIVTEKYADDALHVAHATIVRADVVVSWNFKHLVNPQRERAFNGVNLACGYGLISILTPMEIVRISGEDNE